MKGPMTDSFAFKWRIIEPWHEPDGISVFSHGGNIFTWDDMTQLDPASPLGRYVAQLGEWGFNGMLIWGDPEAQPVAFRSFASHLKRRDMGLFIRRSWAEPETGRSWPVVNGDARLRHSLKLCPYDAEVRAYWAERVARDFALMPDLAGYRICGGEFYYANGAPWMCNCSVCRAKSPRERVRAAITLLAELLQPRSATLFWETCDDDPWGQRHEAYYFQDLTDRIPSNACVMFKHYYWDFHPGWPRHPLYDTMTKDANGRSPYVVSLQQPGEYQGSHDFPWCQVDEWSSVFRGMLASGQQGIWVVALVHPDGWDHPLNLVNWYALARYLRDPLADPHEIKRTWARECFGAAAADVVIQILDKVTRAAQGVFEFDGLWTANHSRLADLEYLDSHLCGPYRQTKRMSGMMGMALPLDMFSPETAGRLRSAPQTRLLFNQAAITSELIARALAQKDDAALCMNEAIALWRGLQAEVDGARFARILADLRGNRDDALIFRHTLDLYFDWKLGTLTEARLDAVLDACCDLRGVVVPEPLDPHPARVSSTVNPASLATFAGQLRRDLRQPWVETYWEENSLGASVVGPMLGAQETSPRL